LQVHNYLAGTQLLSHSNNLLPATQRTILHITTIIFDLASRSALLCTCQSTQLHTVMQPVTAPSAGRRYGWLSLGQTPQC